MVLMGALSNPNMIKRLSLIIGLIICLFLPTFSLAETAAGNRYGLDTAAQTGGLSSGDGSSPSESLSLAAGQVVGVLLAFLGVIFLVLMIAGGVMWMTAAGNDARVATARKLIIAAMIGLVIVLSAYAITTFVATNVLVK